MPRPWGSLAVQDKTGPEIGMAVARPEQLLLGPAERFRLDDSSLYHALVKPRHQFHGGDIINAPKAHHRLL